MPHAPRPSQKGLLRFLRGELHRGQLVQLVVNQGEEWLDRMGVSILDGRLDVGYVCHRSDHP